MRYEIFSTGMGLAHNIFCVGWSDDIAVTCFGPGRREHLIIHYCLSGAGKYNGVPITRGTGFISEPDTEAEYHADPDNPWKILWIIFRNNGFSEFLPLFDHSQNGVFSFDFVEELTWLSQTIREQRLSACPNVSLKAMSIISEILYLQERCHFGKMSLGNADIYAEYAKNYIDHEELTRISVSQICERVGISQPYLFNIFTQKFGMSPQQYILRARINKACVMLRNTSMPIGKIAEQLGYSDLFAFSAFFKSKIGCSPRQYRNRTE